MSDQPIIRNKPQAAEISLKGIKNISEVSGDNVHAVSLRDHPEFQGMDLIVTSDVHWGEGMIDGNKTAFVKAGCFLIPHGAKEVKKEDAVLLITGSENIYDRIADAQQAGELPVRGTLRKAGRAWFLD
jgi:hypothetical protein